MRDNIPLWVLAGIGFGVSADMIAERLTSAHRTSPPVTASIPLPPPPPVPSAPPAPTVRRKDAVLDRCAMGGGVAVVGYDWRVVCLKPASADWWADPKMVEGKKP